LDFDCWPRVPTGHKCARSRRARVRRRRSRPQGRRGKALPATRPTASDVKNRMMEVRVETRADQLMNINTHPPLYLRREWRRAWSIDTNHQYLNRASSSAHRGPREIRKPRGTVLESSRGGLCLSPRAARPQHPRAITAAATIAKTSKNKRTTRYLAGLRDSQWSTGAAWLCARCCCACPCACERHPA
jgi:hypothetical protein